MALRRLVGKTRVVVAPLGTSDIGEGIVPLQSRQPLLVHFGSVFPHKRSLIAISWTVRYLSDRALSLKLVTIGRLDPSVEALVRDHPLVHRYSPFLSNAELTLLLRTSRALIFSSILEGFGLPPVEAACAGTPSTWCRCSAMDEVMAAAPGGHDPWKYDDFARALDDVLGLDENQLLHQCYPIPSYTDYRCDRLCEYRACRGLYLDHDRSDDHASRFEDPGFPLENVQLAKSLIRCS